MSIKKIVGYSVIAGIAFTTGIYFSDGVKNRVNHFIYRNTKIETKFNDPFNLKVRYWLNNNKKLETYLVDSKAKTQQPVFSGMKVGNLDYRLKGIEEDTNNIELLDNYGNEMLYAAKTMRNAVNKRRYAGKKTAYNFYTRPLDLEVVVKMNQNHRVESYLSNGLEEQPIRYNFQLGSPGYRVKGILQDGKKKVFDVFENTKEKLIKIFDP